MSIIEFIFGKSERIIALERAERFYLAGVFTKEEYLRAIQNIILYD